MNGWKELLYIFEAFVAFVPSFLVWLLWLLLAPLLYNFLNPAYYPFDVNLLILAYVFSVPGFIGFYNLTVKLLTKRKVRLKPWLLVICLLMAIASCLCFAFAVGSGSFQDVFFYTPTILVIFHFMYLERNYLFSL